MWRWPIVSLLALLTFVASQPELDRSRQIELEQAIEENRSRLARRQQQIGELSTELGDTAQLIETRIAERDGVAARLVQLQIQSDRLNREIKTTEKERDLTTIEIAGFESDLQILNIRIQALLINLHRQRATRFGHVLAQVNSFHELQVRNYYLSLLAKQDVKVVNQLAATLLQLDEAQADLRQHLVSLKEKNDQLANNQIALGKTQTELNQVITSLETTREGQLAQQQALLEAQNDLEKNLGNLDQQLQDEIERLVALEDELRRQAAQERLDDIERENLTTEADRIQGLIYNLTAAPPNTAGFVMPLNGGRIITDYGQNNNSFIAIQSPIPNAAVWSAGAGVIADASFMGVNDGHMVIVRHSPIFFTVYTNLREPEVTPGQRITQGQRLGFLGGSSLQPNDLLKLFVRLEDPQHGSAFVDPVKELGLLAPSISPN